MKTFYAVNSKNIGFYVSIAKNDSGKLLYRNIDAQEITGRRRLLIDYIEMMIVIVIINP